MQPKEHSLIYQIQVNGHLDLRWQDRFEGLTLTLLPSGETLISGPVVDQSALYGFLNQIIGMGLELISVQRITPPDNETTRNINERKDK